MVMEEGERRSDRTGVGTYSLFGQSICVANTTAFPAVTTKKLAFSQVVAEMACFVRGAHRLRDFHAMGCKVWDGNARGKDELGPIYGKQWRDWRGVDQLRALVEGLRKDPTSRRHIVSAWNVDELPQMCLPPCPVMFQCYVSQETFVDMAVFQRSADLFLGVPFDIAGYALLQRLIAKETGYESGSLRFFFGDAHVYANHVEQAKLALNNEPYPPPTLDVAAEARLFDFMPEQVRLRDYTSHPFLGAALNV